MPKVYYCKLLHDILLTVKAVVKMGNNCRRIFRMQLNLHIHELHADIAKHALILYNCQDLSCFKHKNVSIIPPESRSYGKLKTKIQSATYNTHTGTNIKIF